MDIEALEFRAACLQAARNFFITHQYLELDTPALSPTLIPESCLEVFRTEYLKPFKTGARPLGVSAFQMLPQLRIRRAYS